MNKDYTKMLDAQMQKQKNKMFQKNVLLYGIPVVLGVFLIIMSSL